SPSDAGFRTRWCPESDLNQRPTAYEAVALPLSYRGNANGWQLAGGVVAGLLACYRATAKSLRAISPHRQRAGERPQSRRGGSTRRVSEIPPERGEPQSFAACPTGSWRESEFDVSAGIGSLPPATHQAGVRQLCVSKLLQCGQR